MVYFPFFYVNFLLFLQLTFLYICAIGYYHLDRASTINIHIIIHINVLLWWNDGFHVKSRDLTVFRLSHYQYLSTLIR